MIIIAGSYTTDPDRRDALVSAYAEMTARARAFDGCLDLAITADTVDPTRVDNFERWASEEALATWRAQADPPQVDAPMREVSVRRYDVTGERDPFG